jgi:hypothetical protein
MGARGIIMKPLDIAKNPVLLEVGRKAIEDALRTCRDNRISEFTRGNGLVIREKDGTDSSIIRFGPETALQIGLTAIAKYLEERQDEKEGIE